VTISAARLKPLVKLADHGYIQTCTMMDTKDGKPTANKATRKPLLIAKNDLRYWMARVFRAKSFRAGGQIDESPFYSIKLQHACRRIAMTLTTANQIEAAARAKERYFFLVANGWSAFLAKYQPEAGGTVSEGAKLSNITVGEYIAAACAESHLSPATLGPYVRSFRRIVAEVAGIRATRARFDYCNGGNRQWLDKINAVRLSSVTPDKIFLWKKKFIADAGADVIARRRATVSCNSFLQQAKALFSKRNVLDKLKTIELPEVLPFDGIGVERRTDTKFYGCGVDPHQLLRDAMAELGTDHPEALKAFLLALVFGLRRREVDLLEWQSFDFAAGTLRIMPTKWYALKTNESAAMLPVEPEILALFRAWRAKARSGFVIESNREPKAVRLQWYRCEATFAYLLGWLRGKGVSGDKPLHQMRKLYGSVLAEKHGIHVASAGLRHSDIRITAAFYANRTVKLTPGFGAVLSGADVVSFPAAAPKRRVPKRRPAV
jgi:integrase